MSRPQSIIPTPRSNLTTIPKQNPRDRHHSHRDKRQQARRPSDAQPAIHLQREERERGAEREAQESVRGHGAGACGCLVGVDEIRGCCCVSLVK